MLNSRQTYACVFFLVLGWCVACGRVDFENTLDAGTDSTSDGGDVDGMSDVEMSDAADSADDADTLPDSNEFPRCAPMELIETELGVYTSSLCMGNEVMVCNENGQAEMIPCPTTCTGLPGYCPLVPSNVGMTVSMSEGSIAVSVGREPLPAYWVVDTETGEINAYETEDMTSPPAAPTQVRPAGTGSMAGVYFQLLASGGGAPPMGVFVSESLEVVSGGHLFGKGDASLVWISRGEIKIAGRISVAADTMDQNAPGAGGGAGGGGVGDPGSGPGAGEGGEATGGGGGGGGSFGGSGGEGGYEVNPNHAGQPGASYANETLVPLYAGSGGGSGGGEAGGIGGMGAGALQLVSGVRVKILLGGQIDACGGGGEGGGEDPPNPNYDAAGGGGSGGAILIETPAIVQNGFVGANGGSGGQGGDNVHGENGTVGSPIAAPVQGPNTSGNNGGGGDGSDYYGQATNGVGGFGVMAGGGGGGGGRIRVNTRLGTETFSSGMLPVESLDGSLHWLTVGTVQVAP